MKTHHTAVTSSLPVEPGFSCKLLVYLLCYTLCNKKQILVVHLFADLSKTPLVNEYNKQCWIINP